MATPDVQKLAAEAQLTPKQPSMAQKGPGNSLGCLQGINDHLGHSNSCVRGTSEKLVVQLV